MSWRPHDHFVLPGLIAGAVEAELGDIAAETKELRLGWPLEPFGPVAEVTEASDAEDELIEALDGAEVLVTQMGPVTERVLNAADSLRLVVVCRGGPVNVNLDAAKARDVRVCFAPGRNAAATAEFTVGMLLAAVRRIPQAHDLLAGQGSWEGGAAYYTYEHSGLELEDLPVGLVGYGAVGSRVARVLCAFGAQVMVYDPYVRGEIHGLRVASLDQLLTRSRVITLHARLTAETRGLIGARELGLLPQGAVVVNVARGPLLDESALCDGLEAYGFVGGGPRHLRARAAAPGLPAARPGRSGRPDPAPRRGEPRGGREGGEDRGGGGGPLGAGEPLAHCLT